MFQVCQGFAQKPGALLQLTFPNAVVFQASYIPSGDAYLGDHAEGALEKRFVQGFWLGKTEVTLGQWQAFMGGPALASVEAKLPVADIGLDEMAAFISKLNRWSNTYSFRLPTAVEWEHACRTGKPDPYQAGQHLTMDEAHFLPQAKLPPSVMGPVPAGERAANAWGLVDMHGNVAEWVVSLPTVDGMDELRGGSFQANAKQCACGYRVHSPMTMRDPSVGFRLVIQPKTNER